MFTIDEYKVDELGILPHPEKVSLIDPESDFWLENIVGYGITPREAFEDCLVALKAGYNVDVDALEDRIMRDRGKSFDDGPESPWCKENEDNIEDDMFYWTIIRFK